MFPTELPQLGSCHLEKAHESALRHETIMRQWTKQVASIQYFINHQVILDLSTISLPLCSTGENNTGACWQKKIQNIDELFKVNEDP